MKIIVVGLGRMGMGLARSLAKKGHQVTAVDANPEVFKKLDDSFAGRQIVGVGFDRGVLEQAHVGEVDAVVSCTNSDEANVLIARIAKNIYRVPRVIARLYDATKADLYRRLGIQTLATTSWGIERATELLSYHSLDSVYDIGDGSVRLVRVDVPPLLIGRTVHELTSADEVQVVCISRSNRTFIPVGGTRFEADDFIYIALSASAAPKLKSMLGLV